MNKSELARRFNSNPRTVDRYLKIICGKSQTQLILHLLMIINQLLLIKLIIAIPLQWQCTNLFYCMIDAFKYFGGIPRGILFENMKTVINLSKTNFSNVEFNTTFKHFAENSCFKPIVYKTYRPQTKVKVEALAKLTNSLSVYNGEFKDYSEL